MITYDGLELHKSKPLLKIRAVNQSMVLEIYEQDDSIYAPRGKVKGMPDHVGIKVLTKSIYKLHIYSRQSKKEFWKEFSNIRVLFKFINNKKLITARPSLKCWHLLNKFKKGKLK